MLPTNLITKPLSTAEVILCALIVLLGLAARYQKRTETNLLSREASVFSHREKAHMLHVAQAFCFGMAFTLFGVVLFITHEHARYSDARTINLQVTSTAQTTAAPHENR